MAGSVDEIRDRKRAQHQRRGRVKGIRNAIVLCLVAWIIFSIVFIIYLSSKVLSLQDQVTKLELKTVEVDRAKEDIKASHVAKETKRKEAEEAAKAALDENAKRVYLTFDDGPTANTDQILDILKENDVKATFFVLAFDTPEAKARMKRIVDEGHTLAMHSSSHDYGKIYASVDSWINDVNAIHDFIKDATGYDTHYYRFPGGSSNGVSNGHMKELISYCNSHGIRYYDWNVSSEDASYPLRSADQIVENCMKDVVKYKSSIVLMHDAADKVTTVQALPTLIKRIQAEGGIILPIDDNTELVQHVTI